MKRILLPLLSLAFITARAQDNPTQRAQPIVAEGKALYRSEMASWYGTDLFLDAYKNQGNISGYFSYADGDSTRCIFFSRGQTPTVIGTMTFDGSYDPRTARTDLTERSFTDQELALYTIRQAALVRIQSDTLFKTYKNTSLNLIPLIRGDERKVYVLTGPQEQGVVIIGNDYLISFDAQNQIISQKQLHQNMIPIHYGDKEEEGKTVEGALHTHLPETGDFITATDICTLMLYEKFAKWKSHQVISANYLNIWNCATDQLTVIPMSTMEKIGKDQKKRQGKKDNP